MRLLVIADEDSFIPSLGSDVPDVIISCGDLASWSLLKVIRWFQSSRMFGVKGNHDDLEPLPDPMENLHLRTATFLGLSFGGFSGSWRYKPRGHHLYDQQEVTLALAAFPSVDVFVAHNSPRHIHDTDDEVHIGFAAFRDYIDRCRPQYFFHGHQHKNTESQVGSTRVIGVYGARYLEI